MCTISVPCPLCSHTSFTSVASLRLSLIKVVNSPLTCPICQDVLMGLDKLTLHLITHNNNLNNSEDDCIENNISNDKSRNSETKFSTNIQDKQQEFNKYLLHALPSSLNTNEKQQSSKSNSETIEHNLKALTTSNCIDNENLEPKCEQPNCNICGLTFGNFDVLQKHIMIMHQLNSGNVIIISNSNGNLNNLNVNNDCAYTVTNNNNNNSSLQMYPCHLCSKSYKMKARLRLHLKVKHLLGLTNGNDQTKPKLNICEKIRMINNNKKDINNIEQLRAKSPNNNSILTVSNLTTNECNKLLEYRKNSKQIIVNNNNSNLFNENDFPQIDTNLSPRLEQPKTWKCDICSKFYTTKYFLKKHKRIHTGETPYKCDICKKSFTFQQSYHKHLLYHSDEKPHICKTCGRAFKELSTLHNHERIHSGEKPFECDTCGKRFRQRVSNYVHQRTHTGVKPYTCQLCEKKFRYKVTLRTHKCTGSIINIISSSVDSSVSKNTPLLIDVVQNPLEDHFIKLLQTTDFLKETKLPESNIEINENNVQKYFQNTSIALGQINNKQSEINLAIRSNEKQTNDINEMNEEMLSKSIDDIVAESCRKLFKDNSESVENPVITSPTEQFQNLCLYSPISMDTFQSALSLGEDSLKRILFDSESKKKCD